jgi:hypothetical protein
VLDPIVARHRRRAVFAAFAAPVVLSGEATFAGYLKLDDTASWLALTDRVLEHGAGAARLPPSSYEAMLDFYLQLPDRHVPTGWASARACSTRTRRGSTSRTSPFYDPDAGRARQFALSRDLQAVR